MGIKVMLADSQNLVRAGLRLLLESEEDIEVIEETSSREECIEKLKVFADTPMLLIYDISMSEKNGMEILERIKIPDEMKIFEEIKILEEIKFLEKIKNLIPNIRILVLTACDETACLEKAISAGVDGYLLKTADFSELKTAVYSIANGKKYIYPSIENHNIDFQETEKRKADQLKMKALTNREREVLFQTSEGKLNKEIADTLNISERTVKNHLSSIFRKLNVSDRTQAAVFAIRNIPQI